MNKEYVHLDGKTIITDFNDDRKVIDYCYNLDDALLNLIERMENELIKSIEEKVKLKKIRKYFILIPLIYITSVCLILPNIISSISMISGTLYKVLGSISTIWFITITLFILLISMLIFITINNLSKYENKKRGLVKDLVEKKIKTQL